MTDAAATDQQSWYACKLSFFRCLIPLLAWIALGPLSLGPGSAHAQVPLGRMLSEAERSPLFEGKFPASQIRQKGLQKVQLRTGVTLDFEAYSEATRLDRAAENRLLFDPAVRTQYLVGTPGYSETVTELSDRLIVDRVLTVALKPGVCRQPNLRKEIAQFCFRPKAGRLSPDLQAELRTIREKLGSAPPQKIIRGSVTAASARSKTDEELLDLLLNGDGQTLRRVSILPRALHEGRPRAIASQMQNFQGSLVSSSTVSPIYEHKIKAKEQGSWTAAFDPATRAALDQPPTGDSQSTRYFLTGFTFGRQLSDTWERTFASSTWLTDRYYVQISYHLGAGFGLRFPFAVNVTATKSPRTNRPRALAGGSPERRIALSVAPVDVDSAGKPAYPAVGLDTGKYFSGKEFVLELTAGCHFYASIPGSDLEYDCPSIEETASRDLEPVLGSERSQLGQLWLDGKITGLGIEAGIGSAYIDVGLAADLTEGRIELQVEPLTDSHLDLPAGGSLSFDGRQATSFAVERTGSSSRFGFRVEEPKYGFRVEITPQLRLDLKIDLGLYEYDRIVGPYRLDFLSVGTDFLLPHHEGTTAAHRYEFEDDRSQHSPPTKNAPTTEGNAPSSTGQCSSRSNIICKNRGANCEVTRATDGSSRDLCRWGSAGSAPACANTAGIWTTADSKYAQRHPGAVPRGKAGACITEVSNLRRIID